jgi:hypothetical protein
MKGRGDTLVADHFEPRGPPGETGLEPLDETDSGT